MIPELIDGVLPEGVHECTIEEVAARFGRYQRSSQRIGLTEKLRQYIEEARRSGIAVAVIVDGSYVTAKDEPATSTWSSSSGPASIRRPRSGRSSTMSGRSEW